MSLTPFRIEDPMEIDAIRSLVEETPVQRPDVVTPYIDKPIRRVEGQPIISEDPLWGDSYFFIQGSLLNGPRLRETYYGRNEKGYPTCILTHQEKQKPGDLADTQAYYKLEEALEKPINWGLVKNSREILAETRLWGHSIDSKPLPGERYPGFNGSGEDIIRIFQFGLWPAKGQKCPWLSDFRMGAAGVSGFQAGLKFDGLAVAMKKGTPLILNDKNEGFIAPAELLFILPNREAAEALKEFVRTNLGSIFSNGTIHQKRLELSEDFLEKRIISIEDEDFKEEVLKFKDS